MKTKRTYTNIVANATDIDMDYNKMFGEETEEPLSNTIKFLVEKDIKDIDYKFINKKTKQEVPMNDAYEIDKFCKVLVANNELEEWIVSLRCPDSLNPVLIALE